MDFTFAELITYLDKRFDQQEANILQKVEVIIDQKLEQKLDEKLNAILDKRFDQFEAFMMQQIGTLRQEMHDDQAHIAETISRINDYHDRKHDNHERHISRLESHVAS